MGTRCDWLGMFYAAAVVSAAAGNAAFALAPHGSFQWVWSPFPIAASLILFVVIHCWRRYGLLAVVVYVANVFVIAWAVETTGVLTGVPFGAYSYDPWMEPFVGEVPLKVLFAYLSVSYPAWIMAGAILGRFDNRFGEREIVLTAAVAAAIMVAWDLAMDPLRATVDGWWTWREPGLWLGIPLTNFIGWYAMSWLMFCMFGSWLVRNRDKLPERRDFARPAFWIAAPAIYLTFLGEYLLNPLVKDGGATLPSGWTTGTVHSGVALAALLAMLPAAALAIWRSQAPRSGRQAAALAATRVAAE